MLRSKLAMSTVLLLAAATLNGCTAPGMTVRGQSPVPESRPENHRYHQPVRAAVSEIQDLYHENNNTTVSHYRVDTSCDQFGHGCPPGYGCPPGHGCPPWPTSLCPDCPPGHGNHLNHYPRHGYTYSYERPNDLTYPTPNSVGGAVVYPYYTHKGPSDFFRDDPKVR